MVGIVSFGVLGVVCDMVYGVGVLLIVVNVGNDVVIGGFCLFYIMWMLFFNGQINCLMGIWMVEQGVKKVFMFVFDYVVGCQMIDVFIEIFIVVGGEIVGQEFMLF